MDDTTETRETTERATSLIELGPGVGSSVERIKAASNHLCGQIAAELAEESSHFGGDTVQLLKFHGVYQQENRDQRQSRKLEGTEKAYQCMVRSRIPGGALTAEQYLTEDELAGRFGNGTLRITTRQGLQLHGVLKGDLHETIHAINASLLSTLAACGDVNRNVMACPAPLTSRAQAQVEQIAHTLAMHLAPHSSAYHDIWIDGEKVHTVEAPETHLDDAEPIYGESYLPRKFKIGVAFPGDNCIDVYTNDIGLVAELDGERLAGFSVLIGGGMGSTHGKSETFPRLAEPFCWVPADEVLPLVETVVMIQRDYGDRQNRKHARMKYLVEERGVAWFRAEAERRLGHTLAEPHAVTWEGVEDHLGWHRQADGRWFLGLFVENGRIKDEGTLRLRTALREVTSHFQPGIRLTAQQNILLTDISGRRKASLTAMLAKYGIVTQPEHVGVRRYAMACPALPTCGLALAEAERALPDVVSQIEADLHALGLVGEPLSIRMTGCPNGCARPYMGDIGIVGRSKDLYNIYVGGDWPNTRMNTLYAASVPLGQLAATVRPLLALWRDEREPDETFGDYCYRQGITRLRERAGMQVA